MEDEVLSVVVPLAGEDLEVAAAAVFRACVGAHGARDRPGVVGAAEGVCPPPQKLS